MPEIFQRTMETLLEGQPNVICYFGDTLVHSDSHEDHKDHLDQTTKTLSDAGLKLNKAKCEIEKEEIEFLGYIISKDGVRPDPGKVEAVVKMAEPTNVAELRRMLGMVNFLGKYIPHLSTVLHPLCELLGKDRAWVWGPAQAEAFTRVKELLTTAPTLALFDPSKPTTVSSDASSYGLGSVLLQEHEDGVLRPVAFCSRSLTPAERRYAQIEKECLAGVWACERFNRYLVGLDSFTLETDHKPLVPLINSWDLTDTPVRCQRMLLRIMRFNVQARYTPGKQLQVADALSQSPTEEGSEDKLEEDVDLLVNAVKAAWPASDAYIDRLHAETQNDASLQAALNYTQSGWPKYKQDVILAARNFFAIRGEMSTWNRILMKGNRLTMPQSMQKEVLDRIHEGHQGIAKCRARAQDPVWWPRISADIYERVSSCRECLERQPSQKKEPLLPSTPPERPFQHIGVDICEVKGDYYLVSTDYYSRYIDIAHLPRLTAHAVISKIKNCFAHHGIPETVVSDNGTQFTSAEFQQFAASWNFRHITSSPHFPQSNGQAES